MAEYYVVIDCESSRPIKGIYEHWTQAEVACVRYNMQYGKTIDGPADVEIWNTEDNV